MSNLDAFIDPTLSAQSSQTMATHTSTHNHGPAATGGSSAGAGTDDDADDPIVASINILIKPTLPAHRRVLVLEHPTRSDGSKPARAPLELRTKPATGMVELDFPVDFGAGYDKDKGKAWGAHLAKSTEAKKGGSHGLAGGFGVGAPPPRAARGGGAASAADHVDPSMMDWNEALRRDLVLRTQTLGGQMPDAGAESKYMVGVFAGSNLHLTPATSLVHLRPQLHHLDATTEQERLTRAPASGAAGGAGGAGGGAGGAAGGGSKPEAARAIHMMIKKTSDGSEELVQETMADRLKKVQSEGWRKHRYVHDEAADSWAVSEEALFLHGAGDGAAAAASAAAAAAAASNAASAADKAAAAAALEDHGVAELAEQVAALKTRWDEDGLLEHISGIKKARPVKLEISDDEPSASAAAAPRGKGKAKAPAARAKATTAKATAATRGKRATTTTTTTTGATTAKETAQAGPSTRGKDE